MQTSSAQQPLAYYGRAEKREHMPLETHCSCSMFICLPIMGYPSSMMIQPNTTLATMSSPAYAPICSKRSMHATGWNGGCAPVARAVHPTGMCACTASNNCRSWQPAVVATCMAGESLQLQPSGTRRVWQCSLRGPRQLQICANKHELVNHGCCPPRHQLRLCCCPQPGPTQWGLQPTSDTGSTVWETTGAEGWQQWWQLSTAPGALKQKTSRCQPARQATERQAKLTHLLQETHCMSNAEVHTASQATHIPTTGQTGRRP